VAGGTGVEEKAQQDALNKLDPRVTDLLRKLGLVQYGVVFLKEGIDSDVLPRLTEAHLEKMGVGVGHRIKLLRAIEKTFGSSEEFNEAIDEEKDNEEENKEERSPPSWDEAERE
jgi:hypothetical protein